MSEAQRAAYLPTQYKNQFWRFVSGTNDTVHLNLIFNNVRNYVAAGAILTGGILLRRIATSPAEKYAAYILFAFAVVLAAFNFLQSWALLIIGFHNQIGFTHAEYREFGRGPALKLWALMAISLALVFSLFELSRAVALTILR